MDVGCIEEVIEAFQGLQREHGDIAEVGGELLEARTEGTVSAEEEVDAGICGEACGEGDEGLKALFGPHIAGVEDDGLLLEAGDGLGELAAEGVGAGVFRRERVDEIDVDPVGEEHGLRCGDAFAVGAIDHSGRDAGDAVEGEGEETFEGEGHVMQEASGGEQAELEGCIDFKVLHVEPGGRTGGSGHEQGERGAEEGGLDGEDDVGAVKGLGEHNGKAAEHEGEEVRHALEAGGLLRHVERSATDERLSGGLLGSIAGAGAVVLADVPGGVVGRRGYDTDLVASAGQPGGHLAGVLSDPGELRGIVEAVDQDAHAAALRRR